MAATQTLLTTSVITRESARILGNNLILGKAVNRDYDSEFGVQGAKIGQTINVRLPIRPHGRVGPVIDPSAVQETYAPLTFNGPYGVDYSFSSTEMTFSIDDFSNRFIKPAMIQIANQIDLMGYNVLLAASGMTVGTPGTALDKNTAPDAVLAAAAMLYQNGAPIDDGMMTEINSPAFNALLAGSSSKLFNPPAEISEIYRKGLQGTFGGFDHFVSQNVFRHVNGTFTGSPVVNGGGQAGSALVTDGWGANSFLNVGDSFTIAGVFAMAPQTYINTGVLEQFTVTAATVTTGGNATLAISPAINAGPGGYQNVSGTPSDGAAITLLGTTGQAYGQAVAFHKDAIMLANTPLQRPTGVEMSDYVVDPDSGIGVRVVQQYDVRNDQFITRFDTMVAWASLFPQLIVRIITG